MACQKIYKRFGESKKTFGSEKWAPADAFSEAGATRSSLTLRGCA